MTPAIATNPADVPRASVRFTCGVCGRPIEPDSPGRAVRCPNCQRRVTIPRRLPAHCDRCGHEQLIRHLVPHLEQPCANCGHTLSVGDVRLRPLRRRRATHRTVDSSFRRRLSAATMLLIYAVFLVSALAWIARRL